ncbi:MAG TPA: hydantoinase/oxoprolinase family protein [Chloroflexota bacterium]|nr:hydantoinase/oxoprolinase family protein [Chloroflexota bacterium]
MSYRIGVDIGGTFTDVCVVGADGRIVATAKVRTTPDDPSRAVVAGARAALEELPAAVTGQTEGVVHATTLITNAIVERRGSPVGLLLTRGYRDTLEIARQHRYDMYDLKLERPAPLVERRLRREVDERILVDGTVYRPLDGGQVERSVAELLEAGAQALAICFLHCYANPEHERAAAEVARLVAPDLPLSLSSRVSGQMREYERMVTTAANAYVQPLTARYLERLATGLAGLVPRAGLSIMTSNGGVIGVAAACQAPVRLVESGPAAGALAAAADCAVLGLEGVLSFDMGGTTAKACLVVGGEDQDGAPRPDLTPEIEVARVYRFTKGSGLPLQVPSVELIEIGAGGGSIARIDLLGRLQVGPESAGAEPGPACYPSSEGSPRVDAEPTVTDADVVLGHVGVDAFLGGRMRLDAAAAERALATRIGGGALEAAARVRAAVDESMALAFRRHCAERGRDPSARPLYAFGGAGPVHGCAVAELLGTRRVIVPPAAGVGSAVGLLAAPPRVDLARTLLQRLDGDADWAGVDRLYHEMADEAAELLGTLGIRRGGIAFERSADLRFLGQAHQLTVPLPQEAARGRPAARARAAVAQFERDYARVYGRIPPGVGVQALQWRLTAYGPTPTVPAHAARASAADARPSTRPAYFDGALRDTPVHRREALSAGARLDGPRLVEEDASTTVVPPGWHFSVLPSGHLDLRREAPE